ncbi:MAG: hypothetical protein EA420_08990 [Candidatus Competibacteraceae bacterium]|nr:MAG: hypothetical protein EA420_08990 [Candidatus Competibacteraceae bacterium]
MEYRSVPNRALRTFVLADGVLAQGQDLPESWFQFALDASGASRISLASAQDEILEACARGDRAGFQPVVIVPNADSDALFRVRYATATGPEVEYALRDVQPLNLLDILARPDDRALEAWTALCQNTIPQRTPVWPDSMHALRAFGERWLAWVAFSGDERAPRTTRIPRALEPDEFEPRGEPDGTVYFTHRTAPFAILRLAPEQRQLLPEGALVELPMGLRFEDFAARAPAPGATTPSTSRPSARIFEFRLPGASAAGGAVEAGPWAEAAADDLPAQRVLVDEWLEEPRLRFVASIAADGLTIDLLSENPNLAGRAYRCGYVGRDADGEPPEVEIALAPNFLDPAQIEGHGVLPLKPGDDRLRLREIEE